MSAEGEVEAAASLSLSTASSASVSTHTESGVRLRCKIDEWRKGRGKNQGETRKKIIGLTEYNEQEEMEQLVARLGKNKLYHFHIATLYMDMDLYVEARRWVEMSQDYDVRSKFYLAVFLYDGIGGNRDMEKAVSLLSHIVWTPALSPLPIIRSALYRLGQAYLTGFGVEQSDETAVSYLKEVADISVKDEDDVDDENVDENEDEALNAMCLLASFYADRLDMEKTVYWYNRASKLGSIHATGRLGIHLLHGCGVKKDVKSALTLLWLASNDGHLLATGHMVQYYYTRAMYCTTVEICESVCQLEPSDLPDLSSMTGVPLPSLRRGLAICFFYFSRCLDRGRPIMADKDMASRIYTKAVEVDVDVTDSLRNKLLRGLIL